MKSNSLNLSNITHKTRITISLYLGNLRQDSSTMCKKVPYKSWSTLLLLSRIDSCSNITFLPVDQVFSQSVQSLSHVRLFATPWTAARQASLSITNSWSPPKPMSIESVMSSNHLILCRPLLLLPSTFPNIRVFSKESALHIRWPKYWSFSFNRC